MSKLPTEPTHWRVCQSSCSPLSLEQLNTMHKHAQSLSQILCTLSLACASRSSWIGSQLNMQSSSDSDPAPVSERCNNQPRCRSHILIPILESCIDLLHSAVISLFLPVVPQSIVARQSQIWLYVFLDQSLKHISLACTSVVTNATIICLCNDVSLPLTNSVS